MRRDEALRWAGVAELAVDRNEPPVSARIGRLARFAERVDLHIQDMAAVGKPPQRSKSATLAMGCATLKQLQVLDADRERLIRFGRVRSEGGGRALGAVLMIYLQGRSPAQNADEPFLNLARSDGRRPCAGADRLW